MAEVTGGDLYCLWRVSEVLLPRIADVYYDANRMIAGAAAGNDEGGFASNTPVGAGAAVTYSATGAAWAAVRDELQDTFAGIGTVVLDAAEGVRIAREAYEKTDAEAAQEFKRILADPTSHPKDPASNPPAPGSDEDPGKPTHPDRRNDRVIFPDVVRSGGDGTEMPIPHSPRPPRAISGTAESGQPARTYAQMAGSGFPPPST